jgi:hypothetical protein
MATLHELKRQAITETPLVLFECEIAPGVFERWSTHRVTFDGHTYDARVIKHSLFEICGASDGGIDAAAKVSVTLANADSRFSQIERARGFKGSRATVRFAFFDLVSGKAASEAAVLLRGIADAPELVSESEFRLTIMNSLNLQRVLLPETRIQKRCPWKFPGTAEQRAEAVAGGAETKYSPFWRCGYSADQPGGVGNLNGDVPFTACKGTRADCIARGMFDTDSAGRATRRFGGMEYVPSSILVRSYGERGWHAAPVVENEARYNDFVPLVYGTAWYKPPIAFARNDGNLTRMEVLLGAGEIQSVIKVVVNGVEIPAGRADKDMSGTGWYNIPTYGGRTGGFNLDFTDGAGNPLGDPYGSMAVMSLVVPNRVSEGKSLPRVEVLVEGMRLKRYGTDGVQIDEVFTSNPAWILLDVLRRCGWRLQDIDVASFARAAAYCDELIPATDLHGNAILIPRFQCNLVLQRRRSAADVIRGIRNSARLYLTYSTEGKLELRVENTLALQQPEKPAGSNSTEPLGSGWPAYEFGDGTSGFSGIVRRPSGEPALVLTRRSAAETPNRVTLEFQDAFNEYQQDSISLVDNGDVLRTGQEISVAAPALGVPNFHQAARVVRLLLDKAIDGNEYIEFETSVRAVGLRPGDLIAVTYLKEGFDRQPFRIVKIEPGLNFGRAMITAQIHRDSWYRDDITEENSGAGRQRPSDVGIPRPLVGAVIDEYGEAQFAITEHSVESTDGVSRVTLEAGFITPARPADGTGVPVLSLAARIDNTGGTIAGGQTLYYAITAINASGNESAPSFSVRATVPAGTNTNRVTLTGLSFGAGTQSFNVYRGEWPGKLLRIAAAQAIATEFTDTGLADELVPPPDENYDHANFYWRFEAQPEYQATLASATSIGNETLVMVPDAWRGMTVRITRGRGAGQERTVASNSATEVTIVGTWAVTPDATSWFVIAEAGWHFGAAAAASPVEFDVPNRMGMTVHVTGRAANVNDREAGLEVSPVTRWRIAGAAADADVPPPPAFCLIARGSGTAELVAVGFDDLTNTRTVSSATLTLHYWNELWSPSLIELAADMDASGDMMYLSARGHCAKGGYVQIDREVVQIEEVLSDGWIYRVRRGALGSVAAEHWTQTFIYHLTKKTFVVPFARDFFGSPASETFSFPIALPDARIAAGEMFATNSKGNSPVAEQCFTATEDGGLRTGSGGQFTIQVQDWLAVQTAAAPALVVQESHALRDVFAVVREAPTGGNIEMHLRLDDYVFAVLVIADGSTSSNVVNGFGLLPLTVGGQVNLDIVAVPQAPGSTPGRDLTVTIRF